jgi:oligoendopeptidase F
LAVFGDGTSFGVIVIRQTWKSIQSKSLVGGLATTLACARLAPLKWGSRGSVLEIFSCTTIQAVTSSRGRESLDPALDPGNRKTGYSYVLRQMPIGGKGTGLPTRNTLLPAVGLSFIFRKGDFMNSLRTATIPLLGVLLAGGTPGQAEEKDRSMIADQYKWDLADVYPSDQAWRKAKDQWAAEIGKIEQYKGNLSQSAGQLLACLELDSRFRKEFARLYSYASMSSDLDTRDSNRLAMKQEIEPLDATYGAKTAFIEPEILRIGRTAVEAMLRKEKGLEVYRQGLDDILRREAHTGTEGEEKIIADAGLLADGPHNIYGIFSNADFPYPEVTLSDGKTVKLSQSVFSLYRTVSVREDRQKVFAAYFGRLNDFRRTLGTQLDANVKRDMFYMRARKYNTCLQSALDTYNIPEQVYHSLVSNVNANLSTFHRYLKLRKRILGVEQLHYYDLYAPLVSNVNLKYSIEEAQRNVLASLAPLGQDYLKVVQQAFKERWVDVYPNTGKRSGAYSNGSAYDVHPYVLLNYNEKYSDMSTLAHELGHTMHSYYSNKTQPFPTSRYPIFVAEVASTFNEALLIDHMLKTIKDDDARLSLLGDYLEGIKGTVFRQTQFAEFELRIHEKAERGEALTGDTLNALYEQITRKYYGHDQGVCIVDDEIKTEWSFVPHFYYNFYVYQYATAFTASAALSEQVLSGDSLAKQRFLEFLASGSSDYAIQLLKKAGVDMTTAQPFELTMKKMNRVMDEMEKILEKKN